MFLSLKNKCTQQIAGAADNKAIVPEPLLEKCYFPDVLRKVTTIFLSMFTQEHLLVLCSHILGRLCQLFLPQPQHLTLYVFDEGF